MIVCAACTTSTPRSSQAPTRWVEPPLFDPKAFRIETVLYDVPLETARGLGLEPSGDGPMIGIRVDETNAREKLDTLATSGIRRLDRPPVVAAPGETARVPARLDDSEPAASDGLDIDVRASTSYDFAPVALEISIAWRDGSRLLGRMQGSAPQPKDAWIVLTCVPMVRDDRAAIQGFLRAVPVFDDASPFASLDPGEGIESASGRLSNTGEVAIRYAIDGDRVPVAVELGRDGRAKWEGDHHAITVTGGAEAELVCAGRSNALTATMGDAYGGGRIVILGFDNRCTNVANGFARTTFQSRPGADARGRKNELDLGAEPGNVVEGVWGGALR